MEKKSRESCHRGAGAHQGEIHSRYFGAGYGLQNQRKQQQKKQARTRANEGTNERTSTETEEHRKRTNNNGAQKSRKQPVSIQFVTDSCLSFIMGANADGLVSEMRLPFLTLVQILSTRRPVILKIA